MITAIIRYLLTIRRLEKRTIENFLFTCKKRRTVLGQCETTQGFQDRKTSPAPWTCRPREPVPESHVTRISPFQDIQWSRFFKYSVNLIKTAVASCISGENAIVNVLMEICLDSFKHIRLESGVNLLSLERIIIFLTVNVPRGLRRLQKKRIKFRVNNRFSVINSLLYID